MFLELSPEIYPILIAVLAIFVPVVILAIIVFIKLIVKFCKAAKKPTLDVDKTVFYNYFGGKDNIVGTSINMSRVSVIVNDIEKIDTESLKNIGAGVMISGNTVKCSSELLAEVFKDN